LGPFFLRQHNDHLQSLRSLAALSVLIGHSTMIVEKGYWAGMPNSIFQQTSAVIFFYVLSGFVLGESLRRGAGARGVKGIGFAFRWLSRL